MDFRRGTRAPANRIRAILRHTFKFRSIPRKPNVDHRADLLVSLPDSNQRWFIDVSIAHPSIGRFPNAKHTHLLAANSPYQAKRGHYESAYVIGEMGPDALLVFVMESTGAFHDKADDAIQQTARLAHPGVEGYSDPDGLRSLFTCRMRQRLSVPNARGLGRIFQCWINECVGVAAPGVGYIGGG